MLTINLYSEHVIFSLPMPCLCFSLIVRTVIVSRSVLANVSPTNKNKWNHFDKFVSNNLVIFPNAIDPCGASSINTENRLRLRALPASNSKTYDSGFIDFLRMKSNCKKILNKRDILFLDIRNNTIVTQNMLKIFARLCV